MDDQRRAEEAKRQGILNPRETPPFPMRAVADDSGLSDIDKDEIAQAAWEQSGGSIQAFEALCREHCAGQIDLLGDDRQRQERQLGERRQTATGSTEQRVGQYAATTDNPAGAVRPPGLGAGIGTAGTTGTVGSEGTVGTSGTVTAEGTVGAAGALHQPGTTAATGGTVSSAGSVGSTGTVGGTGNTG